MELFIYILVTFFGVLFSLKESLVKDPKLFFFIWFIVYFSLVFIVRNEFDSDINNYASAMNYSFEEGFPVALSLHYIREPVIWLGQRYIYGLIENAFIVFIIYDFFLGIFLFKALKNFNLPKYSFFAVLTFFPFVLGMQNVYRQWVASIIFLYSFSFLWNEQKTFKAYTFFLLSLFSHNIGAAFAPILFIRNRKFFGKLAWILSFFVSLIVIYLGSEFKSPASTGKDLSFAYLFLLFFLLFTIYILDKGVFRKKRIFEYKLLLTLLIVSFFSMLLLSSAYVERISMFGLIIAYPILINLIEERFKQKEIVRITFTILGFLPMFLFPVTQFIY